MNFFTSRIARTVAAVALTAAAVPLAAGAATASQGGSDDHKVTLCHRTNSENNPYVVITIDKAGVFKTGHDGHDEGGVYRPGDKAAGIRWGDIIPAFDYYASPQDENAGQLSHYAGLNNGADGQAVLANGCEVPGDTAPEPSGTLDGECPDSGTVFLVTGTLEDDGAADVHYQLALSTGVTIPVTGPTFSVPVDAPAGTTVQLQYRVGDTAFANVDGAVVTVQDCSTQQAAPATGSFEVVCDTAGTANAVATVGTLSSGTESGSFTLSVNGASRSVSSGTVVDDVPLAASLVLAFTPTGGVARTLATHTAPATCASTTPGENPQRGLTVTKSVTPTGTAAVGDTLTYNLVVSTSGNAAQTDVTVTDYLPGYAPGSTSGATTYVAGSAACSGSGTCTTSYDAASHQVTWVLGTMAAGTSRTVTFQVVIAAPADGTAPADVVNAGAVRSDQVGSTPSNPVVTPVVAVKGVKSGPNGGNVGGSPSGGTTVSPSGGTTVSPTRNGLPHTGPAARLVLMAGFGLALMLAGSALVAGPAVRRRG